MKFYFVVDSEFNPERGSNRRTPEHITTMSMPFDSTKFNFTKLQKNEIMFKINDEEDSDIIAVNNSPLEWCHSLLIVKYLQCLPQTITQYSLQKAFEMLLLSNSPYLRIAYNGLCAFSSVNHLHWHLYYLKHKMFLEYIDVQPYEGSLFLLENFPSKGFCFKLSSSKNLETLITSIFLFVNYLIKHQIPHNVFITRAKTTHLKKEYDDVRAYVWARKPQAGVKDTILMKPAACEFFGHIIISSEEKYENVTEEMIIEMIDNATREPYLLIKKDLHKIINNQITNNDK
ncbi:PREDICTED: GDP-D-glucose phosphorylase 1 isoform X2 [Polistes dominula]|uniref:GDP-D-glucose phosphorylase 1 n=1 Tax=Polistes dominula TaxID=743375 RepID=A0ABM1JGB0_POLDO|nr:PREDICTED: GDP-D-glucose phosphorylase 1 isoform X2 [Polistes dominula]